MKRELIENVKVVPYASAAVIDRAGFLSGILAVKIAAPTGSPTAAKLTATFTECDTSGGTYTVVADKRALVDTPLNASGAAEFDVDLTDGLEANLDLDLVGCKQFVKVTLAVTFTGGTTPAATATYALALGDAQVAPV